MLNLLWQELTSFSLADLIPSQPDAKPRTLRVRGLVSLEPAEYRVVETLERRVLLSGISWNGPAQNGNWGTDQYWSSDAVPGLQDDVSISGASIVNASGIIQSLSLSSGSVTGTSGGLQVTGGAALSDNASLTNVAVAGDVTVNGSGSVTIGGTINGNLSVTGAATVTIRDMTGGTIDLADGATLRVTGTLAGVTINGSSFSLAGGSNGSGVLDGVTINGDVTISSTSSSNYFTVRDGLTLNGTATLLSGNTGTSYAGFRFDGDQTLTGTNGRVVFGNNIGTNILVVAGNSTLTIDAGFTVAGAVGRIGYVSGVSGVANNSTIRVINHGTIQADGSSSVIYLDGTGNQNFGSLGAFNGGTLYLTQGIALEGAGRLSSLQGATIQVAGDMLGGTVQADKFTPLGKTTISGGSTATPRLLEVMSQDLGNVAAGFTGNFGYGSLVISASAHVRLVDSGDNVPGVGAEALYTDSLTVASGGTLDLNGLHVYARGGQILGTVLNGTVTYLPSGGPISLNSPQTGSLTTTNRSNDWTFNGRAGQDVTLILSTGTASDSGLISPTLNWAQLTLLDNAGNVIATAANIASGGNTSLAGVTLPADGVYHVRVDAPASHSSSTGFYRLTVSDATIHVMPLTINETQTSQLATAYNVDRWTFSATAGQQMQFLLSGASHSGIQFDLVGPNGYTGFVNASGSSGILTLPSAGTYMVTVHTTGSPGAYAFQVRQTATVNLSPGSPVTQTLVAGGQSQLYQLNVTVGNPVVLNLADANVLNKHEIYVRSGSLPTRGQYDFKFSGTPSANPQVTFTAKAGTYYVLVYSPTV